MCSFSESQKGHERAVMRRRPDLDPDWFTPQEAGLRLGFSASFIRQEIALRELPAVWVPSHNTAKTKQGRWRIHRDHLRQYAERLGLRATTPR